MVQIPVFIKLSVFVAFSTPMRRLQAAHIDFLGSLKLILNKNEKKKIKKEKRKEKKRKMILIFFFFNTTDWGGGIGVRFSQVQKRSSRGIL